MNRGRPAGRMTVRRKQALERMTDAAASGERLSLARLAREIGVYDYKSARRIRDDLRAMNLCPGVQALNL